MIKKTTILIFLFLTCKCILYTQNTHMTFRAGMNFSMISGVGAQGFNHFGAVGGVQFNWQFAKKFSFDPEVIYTMKGGRRNPNPDAGDYYSFSIDLDYIEIPALFRWHFHRKDRFSFEFGPTFSFLVRNRAYENGLELSTAPTFNLFDLGLAAGINFHFPKGWGLNVRYSNSIMPIQPINTPPPPTGNIIIGQVHSVFSLCLMYSVGFKKKEVKKAMDPLLKKEPKPEKIKKPKGDIYDEE